MTGIGDRPLHVAVGAGHRNASGGGAFERELTGRVCRAVVELARASDGFEVRSYTPDDGLGIHPGPVDAGPRTVATEWDPVWTVDLFHEIHAQAVPDQPQQRGVFVVVPDGEGLAGVGSDAGDRDRRLLAHGPTIARIIAGATGLPLGGPGGSGVLSERQTFVGRHGRRLRVFAATATPAMVGRSLRFITEVGHTTNPEDEAIMRRADFPRRQALGILHAYAWAAETLLGWTHPYRIAGLEDAGPAPAPG
jgi:hypothetical protein